MLDALSTATHAHFACHAVCRPQDPSRSGLITADGPLTLAELAGLTDRERRMLALIAEGYTNRAIGEVLHLSEKTVRNHVSQLLRKLGFQRRSQAAAWAGQRRLELPPD